jgi:hypothetical protein
MSSGIGDLPDGVSHADQRVIVPGPAQQLNVDRLAVIVIAGREDDGSCRLSLPFPVPPFTILGRDVAYALSVP